MGSSPAEKGLGVLGDERLGTSRLGLDRRKKRFTLRVVKPWHRLPRELGDAPSLETFEATPLL